MGAMAMARWWLLFAKYHYLFECRICKGCHLFAALYIFFSITVQFLGTESGVVSCQ